MNNKKIKNYLKTFSLFLLVVTIITQTIFTAYASSVVPVATDSNAMDIDIYDSDSENNILTLSMTGGVMTAVQWLWALILSICGVSVSDTDAIDNLASDITAWASQAGKPNIYAQLIGEILSASWGATVSHLKDMVAMVKDYFRTKTGYGTSDGISGNNIIAEIIPENIFKWSYSYCYRNGYNPFDYGLSADNYLVTGTLFSKYNGDFYEDYFFPQDYDQNNYKPIGLYKSSEKLVAVFYYDVVNDKVLDNILMDAIRLNVKNGVSLVSKITTKYINVSDDIGVSEIDELDNLFLSFPFPVINNNGYDYKDILEWVHNPSIYATLNWSDRIGADGSIWNGVATKVNIPISSVPSVQQKELDTAGSLTIPADTESGQAVINNANQAVDVDAIIEALKEYVDITYKGEANLSNEVLYNQLSYVVNSLAISFGVNIDNNIYDKFIDYFYDDSINGSSALKLEKAGEITKKYVVINGGNTPNDDNDSNKYKVAFTLAKALALFLIASSLLTGDSSDYVSGNEVFENVSVGSAGSSPDGDLDNTGILNKLSSILDALNPLNLLDNISNMIELLPDKLTQGFALPSLFNDISTVVGNLPKQLVNAFNLNGLFSNLNIGLDGIKNKISDVINSIVALPDAFKSIISSTNTDDKGDENDKSFRNFIDFIICLVYIILLLIMIFTNCIRLIIAIFNIPATSLLFNDDVIKGLQYTKDLIIPKFNISLYSLLTSIAFFLCVMSIIGVLKKRIDKLHE